MSDSFDLTLRHLARIVDTSDDAIVSKDTNGIILTWNAAAERLFGYTREEAVGRSIRMIIPAERQDEEDFVLGRIRAGEAVRHYETIRQRKGGTRIPISLTVSPIFDDAGKVIGASKIARDISDRKQAEAATRRLAAVVESSDDAIVTKNLDSTILTWNAAAERMFGYAAAEVIGKSIRIIIPADRQGEEDTVLARITAGEAVQHYETIRQRKDGSFIPISLTVSPLRDEHGVVIGASKIARDISERVRLEAEAREQARVTQRLSEVGILLASSLDRATIVHTLANVLIDLTHASAGGFFHQVVDRQTGESSLHYLAVSGAGKKEGALPPGTAADSFPHGAPANAVVRVDDVTQPSGFEGSAPHLAVLESLEPIRSYLAAPVRTAAGEVLGGLVVVHAEPHAFDDGHVHLVAGLAGWVAIALENARLYQDVREADRLKDEFLAVLSHELRTPLNAILGYARLLRGGVLTGDKAATGLETLERNARSLTQIVDDVLDISRIVSGKIRLDVQPVELPLVVHNSVATVQPAADAKQVRVQTVIDPRVGPVSGDPDRLQQVVWNLLSNAVKFTPKGGRVQVRVERVNSHIEIVVSDTGVGIRADFLPYVFQRFRQADASSTRKTGGLGLGLSIVRHIVEMHGGTVHVASEGEERGATFRVRLPLMIVHQNGVAEPREHPRTPTAKPLTALDNLKGIRVMAVDDEADALALLRDVLEQAGAEVTTCASASAALDRVAELAPDVLVVDLGMPEMDGFEFIGRLRASMAPAVRDIPAAALTAFARSEDRTRALQSGFELHLSKPVDPGELVASVATLARRRRPASDRSS